MKRNSSSAGRSAAPTPASHQFSAFRSRLLIFGIFLAIAAYWFLFVMGGTFDLARRADMKNSAGRKASPSVYKGKTSVQNSRTTTTKNKTAVLQPYRVLE